MSLFIHIKNRDNSGHHDDGSKGISAYINDPKNLRNAREFPKSYTIDSRRYNLRR